MATYRRVGIDADDGAGRGLLVGRVAAAENDQGQQDAAEAAGDIQHEDVAPFQSAVE